jgi:hypothetical protein
VDGHGALAHARQGGLREEAQRPEVNSATPKDAWGSFVGALAGEVIAKACGDWWRQGENKVGRAVGWEAEAPLCE